MAGLITARILSDHFDRVTIVERDQLPSDSANRKGVPQGNHAHGLLASGYRVMDRYFPGMMDELEAAGVQLTGYAIADADLLIAVREAGGKCDSVREESPPCGRRIDVWNKADLLSTDQKEQIRRQFARCEGTHVVTSALTGEGISTLIEAIGQTLVPQPPSAGEAVPFTAEQLAAWNRHLQEGRQFQAANRPADAVAAFSRAAEIDDTSAELQFRWGESLLESGDSAAAKLHFELARDMDLLRFRCDSEINSIIREVSSDREDDRILLVDAAEKLPQASSPPAGRRRRTRRAPGSARRRDRARAPAAARRALPRSGSWSAA